MDAACPPTFLPHFLSGFLSEIFSLKHSAALNHSEAYFKEVSTISLSLWMGWQGFPVLVLFVVPLYDVPTNEHSLDARTSWLGSKVSNLH